MPRRQEVLRLLKAAQKRLGLPTRSFHSLRHDFCSALVRGGASLEAVRTLAGHSDLLTTQRYVHATSDDLVAAVAKLTRDGDRLVDTKPRGAEAQPASAARSGRRAPDDTGDADRSE